jgi:hypothetical protein
MKNTMLFILLFVLSATCAAPQEKTVVPLTVSGSRSLVSARVGDVVIPDLLLDTGFASDGLLIYNPDYRKTLDLEEALEITIRGAGSGEGSKALMLEQADFTLGNITMTDQRIIVLQSDTYRGFPSNGVIGHSIFGHYVTALDYDQNTMTLYQAEEMKIDESWTAVPLYFKDNMIPWLDTSVVIDKEKPVMLSMYIDFAAGDAVLILEKPGMKVRLPKETEQAYLGRGLSGDIHGKTGYISKLVIGPHALNRVKASFADAAVRSKQKNADAILGGGALRRFNLIFDYAREKLYLKPNKHFDAPFD